MRTTYTFESHYQNSFSHLQPPALGLVFLSSPHVQVFFPCPHLTNPSWRGPHSSQSLYIPSSVPSGLETPFKHKFPYSWQWVPVAQEKTGADWTRGPRAWHNHDSANHPSSLQFQFFSALLSGQLQSFVVVVPQLRVQVWSNDLDDRTPCSSTLGTCPLQIWVTVPPLACLSLSEEQQPLILFSKKVEVSWAPCGSVTTQTWQVTTTANLATTTSGR